MLSRSSNIIERLSYLMLNYLCTTLKISNEVRFNLLTQTGGSTTGITITEIIGVKY